MNASLRASKHICLAAGFAAACATTHGAVIELAFDTLPSAQGWGYETLPVSTVAETSVFSLAPGMLVQNTVGLGDGRNYYARYDGLDWTRPFSIELRSRLTQDVGSPNRPGGPLGAFAIAARTGTESYAIVFRPNIIQNNAEEVIHSGFDTSQFHNYQLDVTPGVGYQLFVDGVFVHAGAPFALAATPHLFIGDPTFYVQARAEVSAYRVTQQDIPEPTTALLASLGLTIAGLTMWRGRKATPTPASSTAGS